MANLRFLHTADWHLAAGFGSLPEEGQVADLRRRQQRNCIEWLVQRAIGPDKPVDVLLLAGDVFDTNRPHSSDVGFLESQLLKLSEAGIQTFIIPGTGAHDAYRSGGLWDRVNLGRAHLFRGGEFQAKSVEGFEDVSVWGIACDPARPDLNLLATAAGLNTSTRSIGLYHGGLAGRYEQEGEKGNAFQPEDVERAPFNYLALGHYHRCVSVLSQAEKKAFYPGCPTAVSFRDSELGERFILEGELKESGEMAVSPLRVPACFGLHRVQTIDCTRLSVDQIGERLNEFAGGEVYMTVSLTGIPSSDLMGEARELEHRYRERYGFLLLRLEFEDLEGAEDNEYLRLFREHVLREMERQEDEERRALLREALVLGTEALLRGARRR